MSHGVQAGPDSRWSDPSHWSTNAITSSKQFQVWRDFVVNAHLFWDIGRLDCEEFPAFLRQGRHEGFRLIHLTAPSGGVKGRRTRHEIAKDDGELYTLLYVAEGSLGLDFGTHQIRVGPGTCAMFDTTRPMEFIIDDRLREISFSIPKSRLDNALPKPEQFCGRAMQCDSGISKLFISFLLGLEANFGELSGFEANEVVSATTEMMVAALMSKMERGAEAAAYQKRLQHVMDAINRQLENPFLTPRRVARDAGLSERQLFRLFASLGTTPAAWVRRRRLERCHQDLVSQASAHLSILEIAGQWGFVDASVFSRAFRQQFGISPRQLRPGAQRCGERLAVTGRSSLES